MATDKCRILQLNSGNLNFGGVSSFLYNVYTHIDREKIQFDFLSPNKTTYGIHRKEIEEMGGRIYELEITEKGLWGKIKLYKKLTFFLIEHRYTIVHINSGNFFFNLFAVKAARRAGVRHRIVHSHTTGDTNSTKIKGVLFSLLKPILVKYATNLYACSVDAAEYMFSLDTYRKGNVKIVKNGINVNRFRYDATIRKQYRENLGVSDFFVIGNVARLTPQKNQKYVLKIFRKIVEMEPNSVLLLVGDGELEKELEDYSNLLGISDKIMFLGVKKDVENYYQAMDVFLFPSLYEGLGIVLLEAQISGLPCFINKNLPIDVDVTNLVRRLSIDEDPKVWSEEIVAFHHCDDYKRTSHDKELVDSGFSIESTSNMMEKLYIDLMSKI